jgi:hypothetical protein
MYACLLLCPFVFYMLSYSVVRSSGVYDGHGGRQIADFLETRLEETIFQELQVDDQASIPDRLARCVVHSYTVKAGL